MRNNRESLGPFTFLSVASGPPAGKDKDCMAPSSPAHWTVD
jgi:hypothetical protein